MEKILSRFLISIISIMSRREKKRERKNIQIFSNVARQRKRSASSNNDFLITIRASIYLELISNSGARRFNRNVGPSVVVSSDLEPIRGLKIDELVEKELAIKRAMHDAPSR